MLYLLLIWHGVIKMQIKTAELTGKPLSWALAKALDKRPALSFEREVVVSEIVGWRLFDYADPATCMGLMACEYGKVWKAEAIPRTTTPTVSVMGFAEIGADVTRAYGQTLAEAVARCVVAMRIGDVVEIPDELCGVQS